MDSVERGRGCCRMLERTRPRCHPGCCDETMTFEPDRQARILFLAPNPPSPRTGGGALRMYHLVRFLGERFYLDLVAPAGDGRSEAEAHLQKVCSSIEFVPPDPGGTLRRILRVRPYEKNPALPR